MAGSDVSSTAARLRGLAAQGDDDAVARIARIAIADPVAVSRLSIHELAELAGASDSSVVRVAKAVGLTGYRELRVTLAGLSAEQAPTPRSSGVADIELSDPLDVVLRKLAVEEAETIRETSSLLDAAELGKVADAIVAARRIDIVGVVASGLVATDFALKLTRVGLNARSHTDGHVARQAAAIAEPGDVMIGVTHSGATDDVIGAMELAASGGAFTVTLTGRAKSPAAKCADHVLLNAPSRESLTRPGALSSRTAQLFVVDALFVAVLQRVDPSALATLSKSLEAVRSLRR